MAMREAIFAISVTAALAGCGEDVGLDGGGIREISQGACGRVVTTAEGVVTEYPASDFGAGLVGMRTETVSRKGERRQRFALYNPTAARLVRVEAQVGVDLFAAVDRITSDEPVRQSLSQFAAAAQARGLAVTEGRADAAGHPRLSCVTRAFHGDGQPTATSTVPSGAPVDGRLLLP